MTQLPQPYLDFQQKYAEVWQAYDQLGTAVHAAGPLDEKSRALVKLALAVGGQREGAVHAHVRKLVELGVNSAEIRQVVPGYPHLGLSHHHGGFDLD